MYEALIFDFDYTLGDSTEGIVKSVNYGLRQLGHAEKDRESIRKTIGLSLKDTYASLTGRGDKEKAELFADYFREKADEVMVEHTRLYEPVGEVLANLRHKGCTIGIVTTKFHYRIDQILSKFSLGAAVDLIVGAEDVKIEKPDPEGLLWAARHLHTDPKKVLYVGDSVVDAKTAERADIDFGGVLTGTTSRDAFRPFRNVCIMEDLYGIYKFVCG